MREVKLELEGAKRLIGYLEGKNVKLLVNISRKKPIKVIGKIIGVYPYVFTIRTNSTIEPTLSYSYNDLLCGNVRILKFSKK